MQIFYINLASRPDRRADMERQFAALGLTAARIAAVRGSDIGPEMLARYCNPKRSRWMTPNELACNLSHKAVWSRLIESGEARALVLEDDVILSPSLPRFLDEVDRADIQTPILRIETIGAEARKVRPVERQILPDIAIRECLTRDAGSAGYIFTRDAAAILTDSPQVNTHLMDAMLFSPYTALSRRLGVRYTDPGLCIQRAWAGEETPVAHSDLTADRDFRRQERRKHRLRELPSKLSNWIGYDLPVALGKSREKHLPTMEMSITFKVD